MTARTGGCLCGDLRYTLGRPFLSMLAPWFDIHDSLVQHDEYPPR